MQLEGILPLHQLIGLLPNTSSSMLYCAVTLSAKLMSSTPSWRMEGSRLQDRTSLRRLMADDCCAGLPLGAGVYGLYKIRSLATTGHQAD